MAGNPKDSKWFATLNAARKRKKVDITLSAEAQEKLYRLAPEGMRSAFVEALIMEVPEQEETQESS